MNRHAPIPFFSFVFWGDGVVWIVTSKIPRPEILKTYTQGIFARAIRRGVRARPGLSPRTQWETPVGTSGYEKARFSTTVFDDRGGRRPGLGPAHPRHVS